MTSTAYILSDTNFEDEAGLVPIVQQDISNLNYGVTKDIYLPATAIVQWTMNNSSFFISF